MKLLLALLEKLLSKLKIKTGKLLIFKMFIFVYRFASRTRIKVGRALSFNKTPSKLKRAVSTMMSPVLSLTNNGHALTPSTQLANMHLASCTNLNVSPFYEHNGRHSCSLMKIKKDSSRNTKLQLTH